MFTSGLVKRLLPAVVWMLLIFASSSRSSVPQSTAIPAVISSVAGHLLAYAVLAILIAWALERSVPSFARRAGIAWIVSTLYGISDEFHQSFVPGRFATVEDVLTDSIGAVLGLSLFWIYQRRRRTRAAS